MTTTTVAMPPVHGICCVLEARAVTASCLSAVRARMRLMSHICRKGSHLVSTHSHWWLGVSQSLSPSKNPQKGRGGETLINFICEKTLSSGSEKRGK